MPATFDQVVQSWDMAFKDKKSSDYVVGQVWGRKGANMYLLHQVRGKLTFTETIKRVRDVSAQWPEARAKYVEDKANGTAVLDALQHEIQGLIAVNPEGGKESRAWAVQPFVEAGNVWLPRSAAWTTDFVEEAKDFPNGAHDDQVDAMTQALLKVGIRPNVDGIGFGSVVQESPWNFGNVVRRLDMAPRKKPVPGPQQDTVPKPHEAAPVIEAHTSAEAVAPQPKPENDLQLAQAQPRFSPYEQLGRSGLRFSAGFVLDEFVRDLQGQKGMKVYREMGDNSALIGGILLTIREVIGQSDFRVEPYKDKAEPEEEEAEEKPNPFDKAFPPKPGKPPLDGQEDDSEQEEDPLAEDPLAEQGEEEESLLPPKPEATPEDEERAAFLQECLDDMVQPFRQVIGETLSMLQYGFAPMEMVFKKREGWTDDEETRSQFSDGKIGFAKIALRGQESVFRWDIDPETGRVRGMVQQPPPLYRQINIPMEKLINFRMFPDKENPEGRALLRSAYQDYYFVKKLTELRAIGIEKDAAGTLVLGIPADSMRSDASGTQSAVLTEAKAIVERFRINEQTGIVKPLAYDANNNPLFSVELLQSGGPKQIDINAAIKDHDSKMAMAMLADFILLGHQVSTGSGKALSEDKTDVWDMVLDGILQTICDQFNRRAVPLLGALNGWDMERLPRLEHGDVKKANLAEAAMLLEKYTGAGGILDEALDAYLRESFGWPDRVADTGIGQQQGMAMAEAIAGGLMPGGVPSAEADQEDETGNTPLFPPARKPPFTKSPHQPRRRGGQFQNSTGDVVTAYRILSERQRVGGGDTVAHGFTVADPPFDRTRDYREEIETAPLETVDLSRLKATQNGVRRDHVRAFVENENTVIPGRRNLSGVLEDVPVVFRAEDGDYIQDGHHRLTAMRLLGYSKATARVVVATSVEKWDPDQPRDDAGRWGEGGAAGSSGGDGGSGDSGGSGSSASVAGHPTSAGDSAATSSNVTDAERALLASIFSGKPQQGGSIGGEQQQGDLNMEGYSNPKYSELSAPRGLSSASVDAISEYQMSNYHEVNSGLRDGKVGREIEPYVRAIDKGFSAAKPTDRALLVYRGISGDVVKDLKPGKVIRDRGYTSTTVDGADAKIYGERVIKIGIPKGSKILAVGQVTGRKAEAEVLLPRGSRFRVIKISGKYIEVELVDGRLHRRRGRGGKK